MPAKIISNDFSALGQTDTNANKFNIPVRFQATGAITAGDSVYVVANGRVSAVNGVAVKSLGVAAKSAIDGQWVDVIVFGWARAKVLTGVVIGAALGPTATSGALDDSGATYFSAIALQTSSATQLIDVFVTG
jgi:translation elongation factor EF-1alpha